MVRCWIVLVLAAACGRVGFDPLDGVGDGAGGNGADSMAPDAPSGPPPALVAYYTFDDDPSDGTVDAIGGHVAACDPTCPVLDVGKLDNAYQLDGVDQALVVDGAPDLQPESITVSAWIIRLANGGGSIVAQTYGTADQNAWQLRIDTSSQLEVCTATSAMTQQCDAAAVITNNTWHHVAYVRDGIGHRAYLDGVRVTDGPAAALYDGGRVAIGADLDAGTATAFFRGILDELRIYDGAMTDAQVAALAAN